MNYISVACDVLSAIEETMDDEHFDAKAFTAERFGVPNWLYCYLLEDLTENGYVGGVDMEHPYLTLKGAEFLARHTPATIRLRGADSKQLSDEEEDEIIAHWTEGIIGIAES